MFLSIGGRNTVIQSWLNMVGLPRKSKLMKVVAQEVPGDITTLQKFSGLSGSARGWWHHNFALLEPGQFSEHLWSPSQYSYLLERAGVPNLIQLTLDWGRPKAITIYALSPWKLTKGLGVEDNGPFVATKPFQGFVSCRSSSWHLRPRRQQVLAALDDRGPQRRRHRPPTGRTRRLGGLTNASMKSLDSK